MEREERAWAGARQRHPVDQQAQGVEVLGDVGEVRVARHRGLHDPAQRPPVRRDRDRHARSIRECRLPALDAQRLAPQEHRRTADDVDVAEAEPVEVRGGAFATDADRRRAVEHGRRESLHGRLDRPEGPEAVVDGPLGADAEDDDRDPQAPDQPGQPDERLVVAVAKGVRQGDDVRVVALIDRVGVPRIRGEPIGLDLDARDAQDLPGGVEEHEVAAVRRDEVALDRRGGRVDLERGLGRPKQDPGHGQGHRLGRASAGERHRRRTQYHTKTVEKVMICGRADSVRRSCAAPASHVPTWSQAARSPSRRRKGLLVSPCSVATRPRRGPVRCRDRRPAGRAC